MSSTRHWLHTADGFKPADSLPISDRGFRYGMAVFETIRVTAGRPQFLAEHLALLRRACADSFFPEMDGVIEEVGRFLRQLGPEATGVARIHVTAGDGAPGDPVHACRVVVTFEPRIPISAERRQRGLAVVMHDGAHHPPFGGRKTHNYWANEDALARARRAGADEALLFGSGGPLVSACLGNVFVVSGNEISTPGATHGAREGVIRSWIMSRFNVREREIHRSDVRDADELFLSNSWWGIVGMNFPGTPTRLAVSAEIHKHFEIVP